MIKVYEHNDRVQEYSCPRCNNSLRWDIVSQMSPFSCLECMEKLPDITNILKKLDWRLAYHLRGAEATKCTSSIL